MKKIFLLAVFIFLSSNIFAQTYESVERTDSFFGIVPALSDSNERTDGQYLPSLLAANKAGYGYIDCNFTKGGLILPFLNKRLVFGAWYENGNTRNIVDVQTIMGWLQPTGPAIPDTEHLMGLSFSGNISSKLALGLNFRYLLGRYFEENTNATQKNSHKIDTDRIEINPSITFRTGKVFVDFGLGIGIQWMTEKAEGTFEYDRETTYESNADFGFWARGGFPFNQFTDLAVSTGFGVLPVHENALDATGSKTMDIKINTFLWNFKLGSVIKPQKWMRIHPGVMIFLYHLDHIEKQMNVASPETQTSKSDIFTLRMMLGLEVLPAEWVSIKAGVKKDFNLYDDRTNTEISDIKVQDTNLDETLGAYFGPAFMYKGFAFISMINLDFFMEGPYIISGKQMTSNWAYVATVEYQW